MNSILKLVFVCIFSISALLNLSSFILSLVLLSESGDLTTFMGDIRRNLRLSPLFEIFSSHQDCKNQNTFYLLGDFEGTSSGCNCE